MSCNIREKNFQTEMGEENKEESEERTYCNGTSGV